MDDEVQTQDCGATGHTCGFFATGQLFACFPPRHPLASGPMPVQYLACPVCDTKMNRVDIVDVCKDHGIWFDAGEVHATIDFVERGGLERARLRAEQDRQAENERLRASARAIRQEAPGVPIVRRRELRLSSAERQLGGGWPDLSRRSGTCSRRG